MMKFGYCALKRRRLGGIQKRTFKAEVSATVWTSETIREAFEKVSKKMKQEI